MARLGRLAPTRTHDCWMLAAPCAQVQRVTPPLASLTMPTLGQNEATRHALATALRSSKESEQARPDPTIACNKCCLCCSRRSRAWLLTCMLSMYLFAAALLCFCMVNWYLLRTLTIASKSLNGRRPIMPLTLALLGSQPAEKIVRDSMAAANVRRGPRHPRNDPFKSNKATRGSTGIAHTAMPMSVREPNKRLRTKLIHS